MWGLYELLKFSFSSLFWGILITALCMLAFFILIQGWYKNSSFTPLSFVVGSILFLLLCFQCTMVVGALKIIDISEYYEYQVQQFLDNNYCPDQEISKEESMQIIDNIIQKSPVLQYYIGFGEFTGYTSQQLPEAVGEELRSYLTFYVIRRLLWCLFFVAVSAILVIKSMKKIGGSTYISPSYTKPEDDF